MNTYRWGIVGLGRIAHKFAEALKVIPTAQLVAVASRDRKNAEAFAERFEAKTFYDNYEDLILDKEVDIVYIATTHPSHASLAKACLRFGKPVLCEKPFAMNYQQAKEVYEVARESGVFIMEALWTRFLPSMKRVIDIVKKEEIGHVVSIQADFGFKAPYDPGARLFNKELGGGALLDVGIYPVFLTTALLGEPAKIQASGVIGPTGVDEQCAMLLEYDNGAIASLSCSIISNNTQVASINGSKSRIQIDQPFWGQTNINIFTDWKPRGLVKFDYPSNGLNYQVAEVHKCLDEGKTESDLWSYGDSLLVLKTLDRIREKIGLKYEADI
ncbi:Gfo/Idh/MocA family oxidoreductase [uncultured Imperialibacter sp.]|uniref:Gfo/Idh/MocA family protein n=1 Tax=uncultured Imperialibacter sp. TaxID=1672639 RepID=UPI0030D8B5A7|tara:strand:- start:294 stop:1277 length:984 start_codon:yes stop_codon:yes gene_type:complete